MNIPITQKMIRLAVLKAWQSVKRPLSAGQVREFGRNNG